MKLLVGLALALLAFVAYAERASFAFEPMDWSATTEVLGFLPMAAKKDLLVYLDTSASATSAQPVNKRGIVPSDGPVLAIRRRNAEGAYVPVGNLTVPSPYLTTNGKWILTYGMGLELFSIDENNQISNGSTIDANLAGGFLLSDDTVVAYDSVSPLDDGNYTIRTYEYNALNNTWQEIPEAGLVVTTGVLWQGIFSTYYVSDSHLVLADVTDSSNISVKIYERQADKSWSWKDTVPINNTIFAAPSYLNLNYNDVDTLILSNYQIPEDNAAGVAYVYTKINGKWTEQKFSNAKVDYKPIGYFGFMATFVDANNFIVTAPFEGFGGSGGTPSVTGKVLMMTRNDNGLWEPSVDLLGPRIWGLGVAVTDYEVIIPSIAVVSQNSFTVVDMKLYTAPLCFTQPINVTCNNQQVSDCSQVNITSLYTVNNPQCGAVKAILGGFGLVDNKALEAQFSFTKGFGADYSCNATVTCPVPPIVVQQTPSKVSSSVGVQFGLVSIFGFVSFLFM